ncbi:MAG: phosphoglycerate mutase family protein [Proteobacteria bacterium]|nr:phosphoglycerate mutase family protein [Pseudomonadota bacterium]MBU1387171.1 phosphoglycerate mutase family protein [Pseudomonadota bacterium]MBU1541511.1 phosphoglycerate mutase family protein [Pseudomonadota bacterium]MBU2482142.1 phosphoglycerate mutase family protein [Pseudomonadota bacterium]
MSDIYFIRHGQASFGAQNYDRLSEKGVIQATVLGKHLAELEIKFDAIYFGQMDRQQKTAKGMMDAYQAKGLSVPRPLVDDRFNEYDSEAVWDAQIKWMLEEDPHLLDELNANPLNNAAFQKVFSRLVQRWVSGRFDSQGDVVWSDFKHQVVHGIQSIIDKQGSGKKIAVFSSGGPICAAVQMALGLSDMKAIEISWQVMNASITRFRYGSGQISLTGFNEITHLELTKDRTLLTYR